MIRSRKGWKNKFGMVLSIPRRLALASTRLWRSGKHRKRLSHDWDIVSPPAPPSICYHALPSPKSTPLNTCTVYSEAVECSPRKPRGKRKTCSVAQIEPDLLVDLSCCSLDKQDEEDGLVALDNIPFSVLTKCAPSELPEDIERLIFEIAARDDEQAALRTLVFVNHRVRKWVEYVIYRSVLLRDAKHARLFLDGLEAKHPDFAAGAVKILALPKRISFDTSFKILSICKDVRHLSWLPVNQVPAEVVDLISKLPLVSLRARLSSFAGSNPDFAMPMFSRLTTLFVADYQDVWKTWTWSGLRSTRPSLKWLAFNLDGRLQTNAGWVPVRVLEKAILATHGGERGIRLCICYSYNPGVLGDRWIHRSEDTFQEERMAVLSIGTRIDEREWEKRVNGEREDFDISETLVRERQTEERRLRFQMYRTSFYSERH